MSNLIAAVRKYAIANYEKDGWDYLVECWEDSDIQEAIGIAKTERSAINACRRIVRIMDERRQEVRSEIW